METSLRYRGDNKHLRLHAKENFILDKSFFFRIHGKLDTYTGEPSGVFQLKKRLFPELLTTLDVGARFDTEQKEFTYDVQGKKSLPLTDGGLLSLELKGGYRYNPTSKLGSSRGLVQMSYKIFNFTEYQDLRLKIGYNMVEQKPFFQLRENNWVFNAHADGNWSVVYDL